MVKNLPAMWEDPGLIPGLGRSPGEGNGNLLQYPCWRIARTQEPGRLQSMGSHSRRWLTDHTATTTGGNWYNHNTCHASRHILRSYFPLTTNCYLKRLWKYLNPRNTINPIPHIPFKTKSLKFSRCYNFYCWPKILFKRIISCIQRKSWYQQSHLHDPEYSD